MLRSAFVLLLLFSAFYKEFCVLCLYLLKEVGKRRFICTLRRQTFPTFTPIMETKGRVIQRINKTLRGSL